MIASLAEALASRGTWLGVYQQQKIVMGMSNETNFMRPLLEGHVHATAEHATGAARAGSWEVEVRRRRERLCAVTIVNIAIRDTPAAL